MATRQNGNSSAGGSDTGFPAIVELNVGGVFYSTSINTLISEPNSKLSQLFGPTSEGSDKAVLKDSKVSSSNIKISCLIHISLYINTGITY